MQLQICLQHFNNFDFLVDSEFSPACLCTDGGFINGILRGVRCTKSLRVLFLHRRPPSWTTLVLYSRAVFIFNEPAQSPMSCRRCSLPVRSVYLLLAIFHLKFSPFCPACLSPCSVCMLAYLPVHLSSLFASPACSSAYSVCINCPNLIFSRSSTLLTICCFTALHFLLLPSCVQMSILIAAEECGEVHMKNTCTLYHRERIQKSSTLSCNEEKEEITKPPTR